MLELKDYQERALDAFAAWRTRLEAARVRADEVAEEIKNLSVRVQAPELNFPQVAWDAQRAAGGVATSAGDHVPRTDGANRPIPHVCFKVPTGGGKTLLAAAALERMDRQTGLTLWIVPSRAIYQQTLKALHTKLHPYRETLERASGGRLKILEKDERNPLAAGDVANYLCVMLVMLPAANRHRNREFLRMFRDSGGYEGFFPDSDSALGEGDLLAKHPDLERTSDNGPVKHSLFNVFKKLRPVVVLDEAHKAYGQKSTDANQEFVRAVNRLDPSLVIELSATPNKGISNLLVDITGREVQAEEMIKLPVQVSTVRNAGWQDTLGRAHEEMERLAREAAELQNQEGRYIRPIAVVRVERTGKEQQDGDHVHAEHVRAHLTQVLGEPSAAVRVKSSEKDELGSEDLQDELSPVRWIITKAALMEGWDCAFAYMLVMLDNTRSETALTQLVGRVIRQPDARRTGVERLDQCYVHCWNADVTDAVGQVRRGLEAEGLGDVAGEVRGGREDDLHRVTVQRREQYQGKEIYLPQVLHKDGDGWTELNYQRHILPEIEWGKIDVGVAAQDAFAERARVQSATVDVGASRPVEYREQALTVDTSFQVSWYARRLADIVPNPWQAARMVGDAVARWREAGKTDDDIYERRSHIAGELRRIVWDAADAQAKTVFQRKMAAGDIDFSLEAGRPNYTLLESREFTVHGEFTSLNKKDGFPLQLSMFDRVHDGEFDSQLERRFARYLDEQKALSWWHRVAARQSGDYYLRGWRRDRIWPDFVAMINSDGYDPNVLVFDTKGAHLEQTDDTEYKRQVFDALEQAFNQRSHTAGKMTIRDGPARGVFRLVFDPERFKEAEEAMASLPSSPTP